MMITLRLYRQHDLDLITLYRHPTFSLPIAIKNALISYVRGKPLYIKQPTPYKITNEKIPKIVQMHISLDNKFDTDIINWLKNIKEGYRNSLLKNIVRGYICAPCIYSYGEQYEEFEKDALKTNENFEKNALEVSTLKGRSFTKQQKTKTEDVLVNEILNGKKQDSVFVENIDTKVDTKALEEITSVNNEKAKNIPVIKEEPIKEVVNKVDETNEDDGDSLDSFIDDIDDILNSF